MHNHFIFDSSVVKKLDVLAKSKGLSKPDILRRAIIALEVLEEHAEDGKVVLKKSDGSLVEVIL